MKIKITALTAAALLSLSVFAACGNKSNTSTGTNVNNANTGEAETPAENETPAEEPTAIPRNQIIAEESMKSEFEGVEEITEGAVLKISDTTAAAGEIAEVTVSVTGADQKWNMCGLHLAYPDVLKCDFLDEEKRLVKYKKGDASEYATSAMCMYWKDNLPIELLDKNYTSLFFTEIFDGDYGMDGDIVTVYLKVPEDAVSGTVYPVDFYYLNTDAFSDSANNKSFSKYAFEHWQGGSVTVS